MLVQEICLVDSVRNLRTHFDSRAPPVELSVVYYICAAAALSYTIASA